MCGRRPPPATRCDGASVMSLILEDDVRPMSTGTTPQIRLTVVLLPEPLGPIRPKISPSVHRQV